MDVKNDISKENVQLSSVENVIYERNFTTYFHNRDIINYEYTENCSTSNEGDNGKSRQIPEKDTTEIMKNEEDIVESNSNTKIDTIKVMKNE